MRFLLAHLSDVHIGPLPRPRARELLGKRLTGYVNWTRGRHRIHDMAVLARLVADLKAQRPDHVAMTGDIVNIGLPEEFALARAWLESLGDPKNVSFVPGNHEAYVRAAMPHLADTFVAWVGDGAPSEPMFPYLRVRENIALIGLSSARPTAPLLASGALGAEQCQRLGELLEDTQRRGLVRIVMIHHPPYRAGTTLGRGLIDAAKFEEIIHRHGAELVVHGHNHRSSVAHLAAGGGIVPVVGVPSGSAVPGTRTHRAAYHLFAIEQTGTGLTLRGRGRGLIPGTREIGDLGP
ncbi:MAG: metallophosphoesterase, partial [Methylobacteriaceae bacterium]|nr:metallophosphoesterase [Methylobacteriaceae bacterium]